MPEAVVAPSPSEVIAAGVVWPVLCTIVVALRFYTRRVQGAKLLLDDWLTIPTLILTFGMGAALVFGVHRKALGYPTVPSADPSDPLDNNNSQVRINSQLVWIFELIQIPALAGVKLSFIFFYRRIFCTGVGNIFRKVTTATVVLIIAWVVAFEFGLLFICKGHFAAWWISIRTLDRYCHPELDMELGFASTDFITDVIVILLPLPLIWRLHMSISRRLAIIMIFCLGALTVATSITRMVIFIRAVGNLKKDYNSSGAQTRKFLRRNTTACADSLRVVITTAGLYWSMFESGLGLTSACLPTIYGLFKRKPTFNKLDGKYRQRRDSMSSDIRMVTGVNGPADFETYALKELNPAFLKAEPKDGQIVVKRSFEQTENVV